MSWPPARELIRFVGAEIVVSTAALVIVSISTAITVVIVFFLFVWVARKDGEFARSVQKRAGVRRRRRP